MQIQLLSKEIWRDSQAGTLSFRGWTGLRVLQPSLVIESALK